MTRTLTLLVLLFTGCGETNSLYIEVRTDFVPGVEFASVETALLETESSFETGAVAAAREHVAVGADEFLRGVRVAEFGEVPGGVQRLRVRLVERDGRIVTERAVSVTTGGAQGVTLVLARDCAGVDCPLAGDDAAATACVGGLCTSPECTVEMPASCPTAECALDADCPIPADVCAEPRCESGVCLSRPRDGACGSGLVCHPERGCVPSPIAAPDGGPGDSGVDAGPDAATDSSLDSATDARDAGDVGTDAMPPLGEPRLVLSLTDSVRIDDMVLAAGGTLAVVGGYSGRVDLGDGPSMRALGGGFTASYGTDGSLEWSTVRENSRVMVAGVDYRSAVAFSAGYVVMAGGRPYPLDMTNYQTFIHEHDPYSGVGGASAAQGTAGDDRHLGVATDGVTVCAVGTNEGDMTFDGRRLPATGVVTGHYYCKPHEAVGSPYFLDFPDESEASAIAMAAGVAYVAGRVRGVTMLGGTTLGSPGVWRAFVWAFGASSGSHLWVRYYDTSARPTDLVVDPDTGDLLMAGEYDEAGSFGTGAALPSPVDGGAFAVRLGKVDGSAGWAKALDLPGQELLGDLAVADGRLYVANTTNAAVMPNARLDVLRVSDGGFVTSSTFGGATGVRATGVVVGLAGTIFIAGVNEGVVASPAIPHAGAFSTFIVAYP